MTRKEFKEKRAAALDRSARAAIENVRAKEREGLTLEPGFYWVRLPWGKVLPMELDNQGRLWFFGCDVPRRHNDEGLEIIARFEFETCEWCGDGKPKTPICLVHY